jgi:hypothetical protein
MRRTKTERNDGDDSARAEIALIDSELRIVEVNEAWLSTLRGARPQDRPGGVGEDYADTLRVLFPRLDTDDLNRELLALRDGHREHISIVAYMGFGDAIEPRRIEICRSADAAKVMVAVHSSIRKPSACH